MGLGEARGAAGAWSCAVGLGKGGRVAGESLENGVFAAPCWGGRGSPAGVGSSSSVSAPAWQHVGLSRGGLGVRGAWGKRASPCAHIPLSLKMSVAAQCPRGDAPDSKMCFRRAALGFCYGFAWSL